MNIFVVPVLTSIKNYAQNYAFCINENFYTYKEFGEYVSKIRTEIQKSLFINKSVGLVINDDIETYASIFSLWLEGYCYVPLHPKWPFERCVDIVNQVGIDLILDSSVKSRYENRKVINSSKINYDCDNLNICVERLKY